MSLSRDPGDLGLTFRHCITRGRILANRDNRPSAMEGEEVVLGSLEPGDFACVAFVPKNGVVLECPVYHDTENVFGEATSWTAP